jgi:hypothetical protein
MKRRLAGRWRYKSRRRERESKIRKGRRRSAALSLPAPLDRDAVDLVVGYVATELQNERTKETTVERGKEAERGEDDAKVRGRRRLSLLVDLLDLREDVAVQLVENLEDGLCGSRWRREVSNARKDNYSSRDEEGTGKAYLLQ